MSYELIFTPFFERELKQLTKKYPSIKKDLAVLGQQLLESPEIGVPLGKKCYKIRMPVTGKKTGKSGGARVITHVAFIKEKIYLISIFDKSEKENISDRLLQQLLKIINE
jgi:mRNA-degrading endonuclease RelE of RelBE toxin-antitoxin system